ncbi:large subunit ribosomal protein L6e [Sphaeroforma arctica JP610]|uniref:Large subunit ribosomal protein L6e n=1 Tax=Sphaeroforma arctica JP610 TaxID=667725 RepID=A0A0L0GAN3_9EUKA|nr:large subunit ribosomal protein L6e [Sphaeroforma arctica JP610]KNC85318.1 large subunit ribosomal protein L6e [Sphaeroforma arctica JP610]|eukprot:XP_014159220.1 large subunit ribosomal protein L6e [Sphaeroforma arctica JP610]
MVDHAPRNSNLAFGVNRLGRAAVYKKRALYRRKKTTQNTEKAAPATTKTKEIGGDKNGKTRTVPLQKESRFYATEDTPRPLVNRKHAKAAKLRASITPGTVLICLSGPNRGKRVVFLKQLASGLLLVTGPFKINGVPLRRINQAYVIATSTSIDISGVSVADKFDDAYFARPSTGATEKSEKKFFATGDKEKKAPAASRVSDQKEVDSAIISAIAKEPMMKSYLAATFSLKKGQYPHLMKF